MEAVDIDWKEYIINYLNICLKFTKVHPVK